MAARRWMAVAGMMAAVGGAVASCATGPDPQVARNAQTALLGMSREQLLSCAGVPTRQATTNGVEYFTYEMHPGAASASGAGIGLGAFGGSGGGGLGVGLGLPLAGGGTPGCVATFVLDGGVVRQLSYQDRAVAPACTTIVRNCMPPNRP